MDQRFDQHNNRRAAVISDEQMELIADKAAEKAVRKLTDNAYKSIGKSVTEKFLYIVGVIAVAVYFWLQGKGWVK